MDAGSCSEAGLQAQSGAAPGAGAAPESITKQYTKEGAKQQPLLPSALAMAGFVLFSLCN